MKYFNQETKIIKNPSLYYDKKVYNMKNYIEKESEELEKIIREINPGRDEFDLYEHSSRINRSRKHKTFLKISSFPNIRDRKNFRREKNKFTKEQKFTLELLKDAEKERLSKKSLEITRKTYKKVLEEYNLNKFDLSKPLNSLNIVRERFIYSLIKNGKEVVSIKKKLQTPMLIGIGIPSIDEIGFYWNRNYGIPTIPGSTFKGAFSTYFKDLEMNEIKDEIFGTQESSGKVIFLECIPTDKIELIKEIQTPHFGKYYTENKAPNDIYNPIPLSYMSVNSGTEFRFDIIIESSNEKLKEILNEHLELFLKYYGIGSKTSMGYGRFK
ncbi:type III-B CRISPR module RAMP protein Cmr6 [Tepiditoga spiralis]|uniref:Type III-B CRISPR module RAMP protein Cmr6 n=1 Tax=Tepiditoga spiralis TaxID=2108365 RepID=A0A7G1G5B3_9BACT|nr:type III-B CRISPR module RAMP protein Cmr6 [Tepiditoga spiralis]BBE31758.1 type III-B CRISPR module RAMP protein Cmr6 [Tepiditoga spiralis]